MGNIILTERHYKNEDAIKEKIATCHKAGVCDSDGASVKAENSLGQQVYVAKPRKFSSAAKTYVCRDGKWVLKE